MTYTYNYHSTHAHTVIKYEKDHSLSLVCLQGEKKSMSTKQTSSCLPSLEHWHTHCSLTAHKMQHSGMGCLASGQSIKLFKWTATPYRIHSWTRLERKSSLVKKWQNRHCVPVRSIVIGSGASSHSRVNLVTLTLGPEASEEEKQSIIAEFKYLLGFCLFSFHLFFFSWLTELHIMNSSRENE